jgi:hypothetical protein
MLPTPTVADRPVINAANGEISPAAPAPAGAD